MARQRRRDYGLRLTLAALLVAAAITFAAVVASVTPGALVGAIVAALLLFGVAVAVLPYTWATEEREHRDLEAIWRQIRPAADEDAAWDRYAAWAEAGTDFVELTLIRCAPGKRTFGGAPSPYERLTVRRIDPDDMVGAAGAMEELRTQAAEKEMEARARHESGALKAERLAHERKLASIDEAAAADIRAREAKLRRELAERDARERQAQAAAVARALRRP